jgi:hypothetical protein
MKSIQTLYFTSVLSGQVSEDEAGGVAGVFGGADDGEEGVGCLTTTSRPSASASP